LDFLAITGDSGNSVPAHPNLKSVAGVILNKEILFTGFLYGII